MSKILALVVLVVASCSPHHSHADPVVGAWGPMFPLPNIAIHASVLPQSDDVLMCFATMAGVSTRCWTWNATSGAVTDADFISALPDLMCGGNILRDDGKLVMYGGRNGAKHVVRYTPGTGWSIGPQLSSVAYYPTVLRFHDPASPSGQRVCVFAGQRQFVDCYDPHDYSLTVLPRLPASANITVALSQLYPRMQRTPGPKLVMLGKDRNTKWFDPGTNTWSPLAGMLYANREDGTSVPLPGDGCEFLVLGGAVSVVTKSMERINVCAEAPVFRATASLTYGRQHPATVLLPDGTVLVVGGWASAVKPLWPELYDPAAETLTPLAKQNHERGYHAIALLLPDARVVYAGGTAGENGKKGEVFSPPYLFKGPRPDWHAIAGHEQAPVGGVVQFTSDTPEAIARVTLVRPGPISHSLNNEQQHFDLAFTVTGGMIDATLPTNPYLALPGWYMAFALNSAGVPSMAAWVRIQP